MRNETEMCLRDRAFYHYNAYVAGVSIHENMLATCQNSSNEYAGTKSPNMFMGLTLYDLTVDLIRTDGTNYDVANPLHVPYLTHVDMLHEAPNCSGVVSVNKIFEDTRYTNRYLHTDNINAQVVVTDFRDPHGPGAMDHASATVERLYGLPLTTMMGGVDADASREIAYVADKQNNGIFEIYYKSGSVTKSARYDYPIYSAIDEQFVYSIREHISWKFVAQISDPLDVALDDYILYVLDSAQKVHIIDTRTFTNKGHFQTTTNARGIKIISNTLYVIGDELELYAYSDNSDQLVLCDTEQCQVKYLNQSCSTHHDCQSFKCIANICVPFGDVEYNQTNNLASYLSSDTYNRSFVSQHILTGGFGSYANYLNLYPIMEPGFCSAVGNASGTPDCELIDYDSLLLGNCWGHPCLPNHLHCLHGGAVIRTSTEGYICNCTYNYTADDCHVLKMTDPILSPPPTSSSTKPPPAFSMAPPPPSTVRYLVFVARIESTIDTFDQESYKMRIASLIGVNESKIVLQIEAASIRVTARIEFDEEDTAVETELSLQNYDTSQFSMILNVSVISIEDLYIRDPSDDGPDSPPNERSLLYVIPRIVVLVSFVCIVLWLPWSCPQNPPKYPAVPPSPVPALPPLPRPPPRPPPPPPPLPAKNSRLPNL